LEIRVSTILKALQRLEDEKSADAGRSLDEQVVARRPPPDPERRGLKIGAVAIGGLAVAAAAFLFWLTREEPAAEVAMEPPPPATAPETAAKTKVAAEKPRREPSARPAPAARAQGDSSEVEISSVVEVVQYLDAPPADSAAPAASPERAASRVKVGAERPARRSSANKPDPLVARGAAESRTAPEQVANAKPPATEISENSAPVKPAPAPPAPVEVAVVAAKPAPAPPAPVEVAAVAVKPAPAPPAPVEVAAVAAKPALTAASASFPTAIRESEQRIVQRAKLPTLSVKKTIWHPDAYRRVAVVKLTDTEEVLRLKEGDAVGPLVVQTINPSSVLFNHDGVEITYNVGR
jgi:hypothetical protein